MTDTSRAPDTFAATPTGVISVRFFAAAAEAAGVEELDLPVPAAGIALPDLLAQLPQLVQERQSTARRGDAASGQHEHDDSAATPSLERVCARSSFLINGVRAQAPTGRLNPGDQLDVLPPFAGG